MTRKYEVTWCVTTTAEPIGTAPPKHVFGVVGLGSTTGREVGLLERSSTA